MADRILSLFIVQEVASHGQVVLTCRQCHEDEYADNDLASMVEVAREHRHAC